MVHVKCPNCGEIRYRATMPCEVIVDGAGNFLEQRNLHFNCNVEGPYICENCGKQFTKLPIKNIEDKKQKGSTV